MEDLTMQYVQIITQAGLARSGYIEAVHKAEAGDFQGAYQLEGEANSQFLEVHRLHSLLIQREAAGEPIPANLMLIHTEDQLSAAEQFKILSLELIHTYERLTKLETR